MEIASDILKKNYNQYKYDVDVEFKKLNLLEMAKSYSFKKFSEIINSDFYIEKTNLFLNQFIKGNTNDVAKSLLMAYLISAHGNHIFSSYKTTHEKLLILNANQLIVKLEEYLFNNFVDKDGLSEILDHYYSIYKVWENKDSIEKIEKIFENLQEEIELKNIKERRMMNIYNQNDTIINYFQQSFELNTKYSIKLILNKYPEIIKNNSQLESFFWKNIKKSFKHSSEVIFLIILSELRVHLIHKLTSPQEKKDLYYNLDIEEIIKKIREDKFTKQDRIKIMNLLQEKISIINNNYQKKKVHITNENDNTIKLFRHMYNGLF